jgi:nucleotide-binding universal stress UspA family protein
MFEHILIAVDGSHHSDRALQSGVEVARKFGADVFVLHVRERDLGRAAAFPLETSDEATELIQKTVATIKNGGLRATGEVQDAIAGHAAKHIVETAKARGIDLIVMGSRGLSDIAGLLLGSVTHKVIQLAQVPVLIVRAPEKVPEKVSAGSATEAKRR